MSKSENIDSRSNQTIEAGHPELVVSNDNSSDEKREREETPEVANPVIVSKLNMVVLKQLALQLEYYFSTYNLSKDTYVQTLRNLNDGCVPVRILANFGKVKAIAALESDVALLDEEIRINAILDTIKERCTELLQIHSVDAATGKIISSGCNEVAVPGKTILAIGTTTNEPLNVDPLSTSPILLPRSITNPQLTTTNTIILRDVPLAVTEDEIRTLINDIDGCPTLTSVTKDVANCWFITFDTEEREPMMNVMMQLRSMTLGGEYIMARLKASSTTLAETDLYNPIFAPFNKKMTFRQTSNHSDGSKQKKKKKNRSKKLRNRQNQPQSSLPGDSPVASSNQVDTGVSSLSPMLSEDQFPLLQDDKKVEWETPMDVRKDASKGHDDDSKSAASGECLKSGIALSDAASTATTTSSSLESVQKKTIPMGGYAAALLKPAPSKLDETKKSHKVVKNMVTSKESGNATTAACPTPIAKEKKVDMTATPVSSWGLRPSFADILRQEKVDVAVPVSRLKV